MKKMNSQDIKDGLVCIGDYIQDQYSNGLVDYREIIDFQIHDDYDATVVFSDGGVMGINEINDRMIFLESELPHAEEL